MPREIGKEGKRLKKRERVSKRETMKEGKYSEAMTEKRKTGKDRKWKMRQKQRRESKTQIEKRERGKDRKS